MSTEDGQGEEAKKEGDALVAFLLENRTLVNYASIIMIVLQYGLQLNRSPMHLE